MTQLTVVNSKASVFGFRIEIGKVECGLHEVGFELPTEFLLNVEVMCSEIIVLGFAMAIQNVRRHRTLFVCKRRAVLWLGIGGRSESLCCFECQYN
ncbi:hypothetical protein Vadar_021816 [Vaccinium darrowii]|uniref:Uncharacterized protein n=1 Tax=Vaccinium darrowii TaxID=229202 RepID=A0ACB7YYC4_9ERIC|nr:hypothetical protein Vadar_021816 [Vaccinium darrowii]